MSDRSGPMLLGKNEGEAHWVLGSKYTFKVGGKETGGDFLLLEAEISPGQGPPPHIHRREDEVFMVLEGTLTVMADGKIHEAGPGTTAFLPRDIKHTFWNDCGRSVRAIILASPAGIEEFFRRIGRKVSAADKAPPPVTPDDVARVYEWAPQYGIELDPLPGA